VHFLARDQKCFVHFLAGVRKCFVHILVGVRKSLVHFLVGVGNVLFTFLPEIHFIFLIINGRIVNPLFLSRFKGSKILA
jgi:hypothetical protein